MYMKRLLSVAVFVLLSFVMMGQSIESLTVRFRGQLNGSMYQRLDSVTVTNTVRGWSETVIYPDTVIVLNLMVNVPEKEISAAGFEQNVPNPFDCHTMVELSIPQDEKVCLQLYDELGKLCSELNVNLLAGSHSFEISASKPQMYILKAVAGAKTYSVRMLNVGRGGSDGIQYSGYAGITAKLYSENEFVLGDNIQYVGYATIDGNFVESRTINQVLYINQEVILHFTYYSILQVETLAATEVTRVSAKLNGLISYDGNLEITDRGFYYGLTPDALDNQVESSSTEMNFSATIDSLDINTTYYYKAYATNSDGTYYGSVMSFTTATVGDPTGTLNGYDWVDLGLPSATKWATFNVGATAPEESGNYYAWAEVYPKERYNWQHYDLCAGSEFNLLKYCCDTNFGYGGFVDTLTVLQPVDDAATFNWGSGWRTPTKEEFVELVEYCTHAYTTLNGVPGLQFTGPNGYSIFLPSAGFAVEATMPGNDKCTYWTSTLCPCTNGGGNSPQAAIIFDDYVLDLEYWTPSGITLQIRCWGRPVRPVCR